jgi:hypothetical protein
MLEVANWYIPLTAGRQFLVLLLISNSNTNSALAVPFVAFLIQINLSEFQSVSVELGTENLKGSVLCPLTQKRQTKHTTYFNSRVPNGNWFISNYLKFNSHMSGSTERNFD